MATATLEAPTMGQLGTPPPFVPQTSTVVADRLGHQVSAALLKVDITVRCWTGRKQIKKVEMSAPDENGQQREINNKMVTAPAAKLEWHPIFKALHKNENDIRLKIWQFAVPSNGKDGVYLVPVSQWGNLMQEINLLASQRDEIARRLHGVWYSEYIPGVRDRLPDHFYQFEQFLSRMGGDLDRQTNNWRPNVSKFVPRFGVIWDPPDFITPFTPDPRSMTGLSPSDRDELINQTAARYREIVTETATTITTSVLGEIADLCEVYLHAHKDGKTGEMLRAKLDEDKDRKTTFLTNITDILDRAARFKDFTTAEIAELIENTRAAVGGISITDFNSNPHVRNALRNALSPLHAAVDQAVRDAEQVVSVERGLSL